jgi:hypothetical protein
MTHSVMQIPDYKIVDALANKSARASLQLQKHKMKMRLLIFLIIVSIIIVITGLDNSDSGGTPHSR